MAKSSDKKALKINCFGYKNKEIKKSNFKIVIYF